jgi:hypothetical protein
MKHIEVMKEALEVLLDVSNTDTYQNEDDSIGCKVCCGVVSYRPHSLDCKTMKSITHLRKAIAEAEKESVQEPCGRLESDPDEGHIFVPRIEGDWSMLGEDLYTKAPLSQQRWIGLTEEEVASMVDQSDLLDMFEHIGWYSSPKKSFKQKSTTLIKQIEIKLKEKNS